MDDNADAIVALQERGHEFEEDASIDPEDEANESK